MRFRIAVAAFPALYEAMLAYELPLGSGDGSQLRAFAPRFQQLCARAGGLRDLGDDPARRSARRERLPGRRHPADPRLGRPCVSHPFITPFVTFLHLEEMSGLRAGDRWFTRLRDAYLEPWGTIRRAPQDVRARAAPRRVSRTSSKSCACSTRSRRRRDHGSGSTCRRSSRAASRGPEHRHRGDADDRSLSLIPPSTPPFVWISTWLGLTPLVTNLRRVSSSLPPSTLRSPITVTGGLSQPFTMDGSSCKGPRQRCLHEARIRRSGAHRRTVRLCREDRSDRRGDRCDQLARP